MAGTIPLAELLVRVAADISEYTSGIDEAIRKGHEAESALSGIGKGLSAVFTVPLAAIGGASLRAAGDLKEALNTIRVETGATGAQLDALNSSFKTVFVGVPDSAREVADAIGSLNQRLGLTGAPLEKLAEQVLELANVTHSSLQPLIAAVTRTFADWSIATEKQAGALDYLFRVSQGTGINITKLNELIVQFGAPLRALGFSFEQAAVLIGRFEKEGVNLETVMPGLRRELGAFAKAGIDAAAGFQAVIEKIKNAKTDAEGLTLAIQVFGQRAATDVFRGIKEGRFAIDEMTESFKRSTETIHKADEETKTFSERIKEAAHEINLALEPIGKVIAGAMRSAFESLKPFIAELGQLSQKFAELPQHTQNVVIGVGAIAAAAGPALLALQKLSSVVIKPVISLGSEILAGLGGLAGAVKNVVFAIQNGLTGALTGGELALLRFGQAGLIAVAAIASFAAIGDVKVSIDALTVALANNVVGWDAFVASIKSAATDMLSTIGSALGSVGTFLGSVWNEVAGAIPEPVKQAFKESGNWIVSNLRNLANEIEHINLWQILKNVTPPGAIAMFIRETAEAVEYVGGKYAVMEAAAKRNLQNVTNANLDASRISKQALDEAARRAGIDTRSAQDKATAPKGTLPKVDLSKLPAAQEALRKAQEEARKYAEALEMVGLAVPHTEKLAEALDRVTKAFAQGKISADQFGTAVFNAIEKELAGARKMADSDFTVGVNPEQIKAFKAQFDGITNGFKKGQLSVEEYRDALANLEKEFGQATGTLGRIGLEFFRIPSHEELEKSAAEARKYFEYVQNDATRMWYEIDEARKKAVAIEDKSDKHARALAIANLPSPKMLAAVIKETTDAYNEIWNNAASTWRQKSAIWQKQIDTREAGDDYAWALKFVGLPTPEQLDKNLADAQAAYDKIINNVFSTRFQKLAARQAVITAEDAQDLYAQALKLAGFQSPQQLQQNLEKATLAYIVILSDARSTLAQKSKALRDVQAAQAALDPYKEALKLLNLQDPAVLQTNVNDALAAYKTVMDNAAHTLAQERGARRRIAEAEDARDAVISDADWARRALGLPPLQTLKKDLDDAIKAYEILIADANAQIEDVVKGFKKQQAEKARQAGSVESALAALNIPSQEELELAAEAAEEYYQRIAKAAKDGTETWIQSNQALIASVDAAVKAGKELADSTVEDYLRALDQLNNLGSKLKFAENIKGEFNRAFDALESDIAKNLIVWGKWGDDIKNIGKNLAEDLLKTFIAKLFKPLTDEFSTLAATAATKLGGILGLFSGGGNKKTGAGTDVLDAVEGGVDSVKSGATKGSGGLLGAIGGFSNLIAGIGVAVNAISGIVQGIQGAHANSLLDKIEKSTRGTLNQLISLQLSANQYWPILKEIYEDYLWTTQLHMLMEIRDAIQAIGVVGLGSGGGTNYRDQPKPAPSQPNNTAQPTPTSTTQPFVMTGPQFNESGHYTGRTADQYYTGPADTLIPYPREPQAGPGPSVGEARVTTVPYVLYQPSGAENPYPTDELLNEIRKQFEAMGRKNVVFNQDHTVSYVDWGDYQDWLASVEGRVGTPPEQATWSGARVNVSELETAIAPLTTATQNQTRVLHEIGEDFSQIATVLEPSRLKVNTLSLGGLPSSAQQAEIDRLRTAIEIDRGLNLANFDQVQNDLLRKINEIMATGKLDDGATASFTNADVTFDRANVTFSNLDFSAPSVPASPPAQSFASLSNLPAANSGATVNIYNPTFDSQSRIDSLVATLESRGARF